MPGDLYVLRTGRMVEVFGDPVDECLVANLTLAKVRREAARRTGLRVHTVDSLEGLRPPYFHTSDDVFFTFRLLDAFIAEAEASNANCRVGLVSNMALDRMAPGHGADPFEGGWLYDLHYVVDPELDEEQPLLFAMDDLELSTVRYPKALRSGGTDTFCESSIAIVSISSPVHVYQANMHQNVEILSELLRSKRGNVFGPGVSIHESAVVEGSTLGPGVYVGAQSIVRNSVLGKDVVIADAVVVHRSVIGDGTQIYPQCRVIHSVMYPESFLSHSPFQFSLMGREAAVFATIVCDARMDQKTIKTIVGGRAIDSGHTFLGLTVGHRAKVAGGVVSEPGRIVPNDVVVYPPEGTTYKG